MAIYKEYALKLVENDGRLYAVLGQELVDLSFITEKLEEDKQEGVESFGMYQNLARAFQTRETRLEGTAEPEEEAEKG